MVFVEKGRFMMKGEKKETCFPQVLGIFEKDFQLNS